MKQIIVTDEQKEKLLEMCKTLFPEYKYWWIRKSKASFYYIGYSNKKCLGFYLDGEDIHWYEFVYQYLVERLNKILNTWEDIPPYVDNVFPGCEKGKWNLYSRFHFLYPKRTMNVHPIDYLYEEFKKIENQV